MTKKHLITSQVEEYIAYKQGMGFQITIEAAELRRFAAFARAQGHQSSLTIDLALNWASEKPHYTRWYRARRLETVHTFAKYAWAVDPNTEIPPTGVFGKCHGRTAPYIYSVDEVIMLMNQARQLLSPDGLRAMSVMTAIGLLWATGIRVCELCRLFREDVHFDTGELHIRDTKFHKERYIPMQVTVLEALKTYAEFRDRRCPHSTNPHFFLSTNGVTLSQRNLEYSFSRLRLCLLSDDKKQGWGRRPPRLYDLRHTFACNTIIRWYQEGADVNHRLLLLSTYLGHAKPSDTYWYLTGTPELLAQAGERFENLSLRSQIGGRP
ncbi:tyrosine-type recombinase/integrase [Desulfotomaculum varum]